MMMSILSSNAFPLFSRRNRLAIAVVLAAVTSGLTLLQWQGCAIGSGVAANSLAFILLYGPVMVAVQYFALSGAIHLFRQNPRLGLAVGCVGCVLICAAFWWEIGQPAARCTPWGV
jgi:hypothetical protein